jgi:hypothetical protein
MNIILHDNGKDKRMHLADMDMVQHKLVIPTKVFTRKSRWIDPVSVDRNLTYRFTYHDGKYYHYQLT